MLACTRCSGPPRRRVVQVQAEAVVVGDVRMRHHDVEQLIEERAPRPRFRGEHLVQVPGPIRNPARSRLETVGSTRTGAAQPSSSRRRRRPGRPVHRIDNGDGKADAVTPVPTGVHAAPVPPPSHQAELEVVPRLPDRNANARRVATSPVAVRAVAPSWPYGCRPVTFAPPRGAGDRRGRRRTRELTLTARLTTARLDARRGVVRLHREMLAALGLVPWDAVRLTGARTTGAVAAVSDQARGELLCDDLLLGNLGVRDGDPVTVAPAPLREARRVVVAGTPDAMTAVQPTMLREALLGKVVTAGDNVSLLPQDAAPGALRDAASARRSLSAAMGMAWTTTLLTVIGTEPAGPALVTMGTVVGGGTAGSTTGSATPPLVTGGDVRRRTNRRRRSRTCRACSPRRTS